EFRIKNSELRICENLRETLPNPESTNPELTNQRINESTNPELTNQRTMTNQEQSWLNAPDDSWRPRVSYFQPPISNVLPSEEISLQEVHRRITGDLFADITAELRRITDPKQKRRYKAAHFPYVTFAGCFAKRQDAALLESSLLMVFDFDHLEDLP